MLSPAMDVGAGAASRVVQTVMVEQPHRSGPGQQGAVAALPGPDAIAAGALEATLDERGAFRVSAVEGQFFLRPEGGITCASRRLSERPR